MRYHLSIALAVMLGVALKVRALSDFSIFYQAALALRGGLSPYQVAGTGFYSPLHVLVYFLPLSLLPLEVAFRVNALVSTAAFVFSFWRMARGDRAMFWLLTLSPLLLYTISLGNIEWMIWTAAVVQPALGILLAMAKPQLGFVLALVLLLDLLRASPKRAALIAALIAAIYAASFLSGMNWGNLAGQSWNVGAWPWAIPIGLGLLLRAIGKRDRCQALAAAPCLSPYVGNVASWIAVALPVRQRRWLFPMAMIAAWVLTMAVVTR